MVNKRISPRDLELLSAYLDEELKTKDRARIEARMSTNSELRDALEELRKTRAVMRSTTRLHAPRNFTISPEMAGVRQRRQPYPLYGLISAMASILLVLVILGDFIGTTETAQPVPIIEPTVLSVEAEMEEAPLEVEAVEVEKEVVITQESEAGAMEEPVAEEAPAEVMIEQPTPFPEVEGATIPESPEEGELQSSRMTTDTLTMTAPSIAGEEVPPQPTNTLPPTATPVEFTPTPTLIPPTPEDQKVSSSSDEAVTGEVKSVESYPTPTLISEETIVAISNISFIRIIELMLVIIAIASGLTAIYLYRKSA
jgi:hypothetical protein